jgi:oligopeptide/dipeptide ABC transporter ATP-binding protein
LTEEILLSVRDLRITFTAGKGHVTAVDGLDLDLVRGEALVVVGESGSGKSLSALSILGLQPDTARREGRIEFEGRDLTRLSERELRALRGASISMIYQDPMSALDPVWTVGEQIAETIRAHERVSSSAVRDRVHGLLARVGLPDPARIARANPHQLSGGMRQRALIAMALSCQPRLLIADEPTTALDVTIQAQILELLKDLRRDMGLTILLITHDMGVAADLADRVLVMYAGRAVEAGSADDVLLRPSHHYTAGLLGSADLAETVPKQPIRAIAGSPPPLAARPPGCAFHPRCARASEQCRVDVPRLLPTETTIAACHHPIVGKRT